MEPGQEGAAGDPRAEGPVQALGTAAVGLQRQTELTVSVQEEHDVKASPGWGEGAGGCSAWVF